MVTEQEAFNQDVKLKIHSAFDNWMDDPMVRFSISTIPAGEHKEALHVLLQTAFSAGFNAGTGNMIGELVSSMMMEGRRRDRQP